MFSAPENNAAAGYKTYKGPVKIELLQGCRSTEDLNINPACGQRGDSATRPRRLATERDHVISISEKKKKKPGMRSEGH